MIAIPTYFLNDYSNEYKLISKINDKDYIYKLLYNYFKMPKVIAELICSWIGDTKYFMSRTKKGSITYGWYLYEIPITMNYAKCKWCQYGNEKKFIRDTRYYDVIKREYYEQENQDFPISKVM